MIKKILSATFLVLFFSFSANAVQHDFNLPNNKGGEIWADLNRALDALATDNSGPTDPANPQVLSPVFAGTGVDDATSSGTFTASSKTIIGIEIDANGTPDTFRWRKNSGAWTTGVAITGSVQTIADGISITFATSSGHVVGDKWFVIGLPGFTKPFQYWADTTTGILKQRSANNSYWLDVRLLKDDVPPVITMLGTSPVDIDEGTAYTDAGATALDNLEGDLTTSIVTSGLPINVNTPGNYSVTYDVSDSENNAATPVTRTVNVLQPPPPPHDDSTWTQATASAAFSIRSTAQALSYNGKLWFMGGTNKNDVWSSTDGITWTQVKANANWPERSSFSAVVYDNKMWIMGGANGAVRRNDVWYSTDGITWTQATANAAWAGRSYFNLAVFDNKMWVMCGTAGGGIGKADVWSSSDGITWTQTANGAFPARYFSSSLGYDGKLWVIGGWNGGNKNDVWSSTDGITWTQVTANAAWSARHNSSVGVYDDKMWVMGGSSGGSEVWNSTNGSTWTLATPDTGWGNRTYGEATVLNNRIWMMGGVVGGVDKNDVWHTSD